MLLSLSSGYRYPPFKQLGNGYLGESAERNKRDTRRPESARVTRASCSTTASSLLRVSPSRAPVLSFAHYFQAPATQATLLWSDLKRQLQASG